MMSDIALGLETAFTATNLLYCFLGVFLGMVVGVIPGIGAMAAISMLLPFTFHIEPTAALIMLAGIWYGTAYGGSIASILINVPGTASSAVACLDGYPMARQGRGGVALLMTTLASFVGASVGVLALMLAAPLIVGYALQFGPPEYFALMLMGLVAASTISSGSAIKALAMVVVGAMFGVVGADIYTGVPRFDFGIAELGDRISIVAVAMGIFGVTEVMSSVRKVEVREIDPKSVTFRAMTPTRDDVRRSWAPTLRGSGLGAFFGALPGTGPTIAAFLAYALEKRVSKSPDRFGKGAIEGVVSPEAANNAADQTAFIPTLTLGIPGSATMALILGALMIHGIAPGPNLMTDQPALFWGLVMSFWIGNVMLVVLNLPLIGIWVRLLTVPYHLLFPAVLMFICIGTLSINNSPFDVMLVALFGALGYVMRYMDWPAAPMLLGFVLSPLMEEHFRRSLILSGGDFATFVDKPLSATLIVLTLALLVWGISSSFLARRKDAAEPAPTAGG